MADASAALFTALTSPSGGLYSHVAARVYPAQRPQGATVPCVVYVRVSTPRRQALGRAQKVIASRPRFQFTIWALTAESAIDIAAHLRTQLLGMATAVTLADERGPLVDPDTNLRRLDLDAFIVCEGEG